MRLRFIFFPAPETGGDGSPLSGARRPSPEEALCEPIFYESDQTLAQSLFLSGAISPPVLCSGLALCGRCRVRLLSDLDLFPPLPDEEALFCVEELARGLRLACRRKPLPGLRLELEGEDGLYSGTAFYSGAPQSAPGAAPGASDFSLSPPARGRAPSPPARPMAEAPSDPKAPVLGVDLGTTSLKWLLADAKGRPLAQGGRINPQMGAGSDVLARVAAASSRKGLQRLYELGLKALLEIMDGLPDRPDRICLAANPAMSAIALGLDPSGLAAAPYALPEKGGRWFSLPQLPPLWLPPQLSPFVGGDISAGYAALKHGNAPSFPWLLADLGTNGEFLLVLSPEISLAASAPMGPALEGAGLSCGSEARPGAAADFRPGPLGLETGVLDDRGRTCFYAPHQTPHLTGLTGTGALSLLHLLRQWGLMDRQGRFAPVPVNPMARGLSFGRSRRGEAQLALPGGLLLRAGDVEELLKVKAAFSLALFSLLREAKLEARELTAICLAGALGEHLRKEALDGLGFLPPGLAARTLTVGNSSLQGALLLAADPEERARLLTWSATVRTLDLAADPSFNEAYFRQMSFTWMA